MLNLTRTAIRGIAAGDAAYTRGIQHYRGGNVKGISQMKLSGQYKISVMDVFEYTVTVGAGTDGELKYSCNCAASLKEKGACKHVIAGLFALLKLQEKEKLLKQPTPEDRRACAVLDYFVSQEDGMCPMEVFHIEPVLTVQSMLTANEGCAYLGIKVGHDRLYKVQNLKKFLTDYITKQNIILGKEFKFIYYESEFDKSSQELLDFILEVYYILGMDESAASQRIFNKSQMTLNQPLLIKLLKLMGKNTFTLNLYDRVYENVKAFRSNPNIRYDLDVVEEAIVLDYRDKEAVIPLSKSGDLIYYNGAVFMPDNIFRQNYAPFFNSLGPEKPALVFRDDNKKRFLEEVLPRIGDSMEIDVPEELADRYLDLELSASIYFDKYLNGIKAELRFSYGEFEFNCFENPNSDFYIVLRKKEQEAKIRELLESLGFEARSSFYLLKNESSIYDFLISDKEELSKLCTLYYSEDFKKLQVRSGGDFSIGLRVSTDMDLLEMDFDFKDMSSEELKSLFRSLRVKKKYYRMQDGSFINLLDGDMEKLSVILENLGVSSKNIDDTGIKLSKSNAFYLEEALEKSGFQVNKDKDFVRLIDNIKNSEQENFDLPEGINARLRNYQEVGYRWLMTLAKNSLGGILADDMGLGKTLQAIVYIAARMKAPDSGRKFLIVCPSSIIYNWMDEINSFAPGLRACVVAGNPQERKAIIEDNENYDIVITSYPLMRRDVMLYRRIVFDSIFLDEAQFIKNAASLNAQSVKLLRAEHRFALTGTPIENSLSELWSIFDFIMPNFLMAHSKFTVRYEKPIINGDKEILENLNNRIRPFIMRRMKKEVLKELPGKLEEKILTEMTDEQRKVYLSYMNDIRGDLFGEIRANGIEKSQMKILAALTRLRQICCHPSTFISNYNGGSGKLDLLMQQLDNAIANEHRTLVFSQFTGMLEIIKKSLEERGISYFYLEGATLPKERLEMAKRFNSGEGQVFLISLKAGGTGLNLVGADTVIHYDPWWNPAVEEQATDRAYRIGQTSNVYVLKLLTKGTIEEKIYKLQQKKKELSDSVIQSKEVFISSLSREELEDIFTFE